VLELAASSSRRSRSSCQDVIHGRAAISWGCVSVTSSAGTVVSQTPSSISMKPAASAFVQSRASEQILTTTWLAGSRTCCATCTGWPRHRPVTRTSNRARASAWSTSRTQKPLALRVKPRSAGGSAGATAVIVVGVPSGPLTTSATNALSPRTTTAPTVATGTTAVRVSSRVWSCQPRAGPR